MTRLALRTCKKGLKTLPVETLSLKTHVNDTARNVNGQNVNDDVNDLRPDVNDPMNTGGPMSTMTSTTLYPGPLTSYVTLVERHVNDGPRQRMSMRVAGGLESAPTESKAA